MRYISRCHIPEFPPYTNRLKAFPVDIRGSLCQEDIYFNHRDVEQLAQISINNPRNPDELWLETDVGKLKYIGLNGLLKYVNGITNSAIDQFIATINEMLGATACCDELSDDSYDMIDQSNEISEANQYMLIAYQHKIELLMQTIEIKDHEVQVLKRDLTIMSMQLDLELDKKNATIRKLRERLVNIEVSSEWI
jgi:hypothetical protein